MRQKTKLLILNFHSIYDSKVGKPAHYDPQLSISTAKLESFFKYISDHQIETLNWQSKPNDVVYSNNFLLGITFDQGNESDLFYALPLLKKYKLNACFFVIGKKLENDAVAQKRLKFIHQAGFQIGCHGYSNSNLVEKDEAGIYDEFYKSKKLIESIIEHRVDNFAFPDGEYDSFIQSFGHIMGFRSMFTTFTRVNTLDTHCQVYHRWNICNSINFEEFRSIVRLERLTILKYYFKSILAQVIFNLRSNFVSLRKEKRVGV